MLTYTGTVCIINTIVLIDFSVSLFSIMYINEV